MKGSSTKKTTSKLETKNQDILDHAKQMEPTRLQYANEKEEAEEDQEVTSEPDHKKLKTQRSSVQASSDEGYQSKEKQTFPKDLSKSTSNGPSSPCSTKTMTTTLSSKSLGLTRVIGHSKTSTSTQYATQFNPPKTLQSKPENSLNTSDISIRESINNRLEKIILKMSSLPSTNGAKEQTYQDIEKEILNMSNEITIYKRQIMDNTTLKLPAATTTLEAIADAVIVEQGLLHSFNVEYKLYESAIASKQYALSRITLAHTELSVAESKMLYILKMIQDMKLNTTITNSLL